MMRNKQKRYEDAKFYLINNNKDILREKTL